MKLSYNNKWPYHISTFLTFFNFLFFLLKIQLCTIIENIKLIALSFHSLPSDFLITYNYLTINLSWKQCRPYYNFQLRWVNHNLLYFKSFSLLQTFWDTFQIKYSSHDYSCRQGGSSLFCSSAVTKWKENILIVYIQHHNSSKFYQLYFLWPAAILKVFIT